MTSVAVDVLSVMSSDMKPRMGERDIYFKVNQIREKRHQVCTFAMVSRVLSELSSQLILEKSSFAAMFGLSSIGKMLVGKEPISASAENHLKRHGYQSVPIIFDGDGFCVNNHRHHVVTEDQPTALVSMGSAASADPIVDIGDTNIQNHSVSIGDTASLTRRKRGKLRASDKVKKSGKGVLSRKPNSSEDHVVDKGKALSAVNKVVEPPFGSVELPPYSDALHLNTLERNILGFVYQQSKVVQTGVSIAQFEQFGFNVNSYEFQSTMTALSYKNYLSTDVVLGLTAMSVEQGAELGWGNPQCATTPYLHLYGLSVIPQLIIRYIASLRKKGGRCRASIPQLSEYLILCNALSGNKKEVEQKVKHNLAILMQNGVILLISGMYQLNAQALMLLGSNKLSDSTLSKIVHHDFLLKWWDVLKLHLDSKEVKRESVSFVDAPEIDSQSTELSSLDDGLKTTGVATMSEITVSEALNNDAGVFGAAITYLKGLAEKVSSVPAIVDVVEKVEILELIARAFAFDQPHTQSTLLAIKEDLLRVTETRDPVDFRILYAAGRFAVENKSEKITLLASLSKAFSFDNQIVSNALRLISEDIQKL